MVKNIERVNISEATLNEDFVVISKFVMTDDCTFLPYEEGMEVSDGSHVWETVYPTKLVQFVYDVGNNIDMSLAVTLGLGVIQSLSDGTLYLYHADMIDDEDRMKHEMLRLGMYYQLMNPKYDDRRLDYLFNSSGGTFYLSTLLFTDCIEPIEKLKAIFSSKKGKGNNVVAFKA
ncbi:hypothetical protein LGQ02_09660 [Bacillus shivajii]|uniref:hypothetical protein n=1 Tax=Bacillus shivajii TaxID=1983719 RepID=UPI001CFB95A7|nr:hypothetical protein [Bacillus shivajii]UCZ54963.1 hypothetical protein LGQ02_09660 [Bacillus shivajii]